QITPHRTFLTSLSIPSPPSTTLLFFFNPPPTTQIYTLSLHDALPIFLNHALPQARPARQRGGRRALPGLGPGQRPPERIAGERPDRKSTRLNSSHDQISYAVFCLKKKKKKKTQKTKEQKQKSRLQ